jgi:protein-disulfide isomerase
MTAARKRPPARGAVRTRRTDRSLLTSPKAWAAAGVVAIVVGALWLKNRGDEQTAEAPQAAAGAPVSLDEAALADRGPRRTAVPDPRVLDVSDDPRKGGPSAPVRVVEFADFQCPSCRMFFENTQGALEELYGDRIEWVFLDLPLTQIHDRALPAAIAAACAHRQDRFWPYHDLLFRNQPNFGDRQLAGYAEDAGLDVDAWRACYESGETRAGIEQDVALAQELGVDGTPAFLVGGEHLKGALPLTAFMEVIDPLLREAQSGAGGAAESEAPGSGEAGATAGGEGAAPAAQPGADASGAASP